MMNDSESWNHLLLQRGVLRRYCPVRLAVRATVASGTYVAVSAMRWATKNVLPNPFEDFE